VGAWPGRFCLARGVCCPERGLATALLGQALEELVEPAERSLTCFHEWADWQQYPRVNQKFAEWDREESRERTS
jgi:hypothetical protein